MKNNNLQLIFLNIISYNHKYIIEINLNKIFIIFDNIIKDN